MSVRSDEAAILEELHKDEERLHEDEQKLHMDEKKVIVAFSLIAVILLGSIAGAVYLFRSVEARIAQSTSQSEARVEQPIVSPTATTTILSATSTPSPTTTPSKQVNTKPATQDYYINVGSGTNQSSDWTDVFGATTTLDLSQYQNIKEVHFEAFVNVPTANGTVSVRLYNATDKHPVWNSEVTKEGSAETDHLISPALSYDKGAKLYQVQMKSQLNVAANLVQSRIHVVAK